MRRQALLLVIFAVAAGSLAAFLATRMLRSPTPVAEDGQELRVVSVAVAERDMQPGERVRAEDVRLLEWPSTNIPAGYSTSEAEVVGRGLLAPVRQNEPLLSTKLASPESGGGMPVLIPEGKRAMSVRVDDVVGVAGWVLPGTRVDVVVTVERAEQQSEAATRVVLQNLEVLSAGSSIERDPDGEPRSVPVVTLLVGPEEAEQLALAHSNGRLQLALRNPMDMDSVSTTGIFASHLIAGRPAPQVVQSAPRPAAPSPPSRVELEVYRGPQRSTSTVDPTVAGQEGGGQ